MADKDKQSERFHLMRRSLFERFMKSHKELKWIDGGLYAPDIVGEYGLWSLKIEIKFLEPRNLERAGMNPGEMNLYIEISLMGPGKSYGKYQESKNLPLKNRLNISKKELDNLGKTIFSWIKPKLDKKIKEIMANS